MTIYTLIIVVALVAQLTGADPHRQKLNTYVKHHSNVMSREIERRLNDGVKRKVPTHHSIHLFANEPSAEPTQAPTISPTHRPTVKPTYSPTFIPTTASPSVTPSQNPAYIEPTKEPTAPPTIFPTPLPIGVPSLMPSIISTLQPTEDPGRSLSGYFYLTESFKNDCSNPVVTFGVPINTCFVQSNYGYKIRIVDEDWANAYIDYYGDKECTQLLEGGVAFDGEMETCQETQLNVVINPAAPNGKVYTKMHITMYATPPRVADIGAGVFEFFENTTTCDAARQSVFLAYTSNVCLADTVDEHGKIEAFSVDCTDDEVGMNFDVDNKPNCAGLIGRGVLPNTCEEDKDPNDDDDIIDDDDTYAPEWLNPPPSVSTTSFPTTRDVPIPKLSRKVTCQASLVPTVKPTASPSRTAFPTSDKVQSVSFKVKKHVINGFSKAAYDADVELYSLTLKQTIASTMQGVQANNITDLVVTDGAARTPAVLRATLRALTTRSLQASSVSLSYTISARTVYTASQLSAQLQQALANGDFDTVLQIQAFLNGATDLENATSQSTVETDIDENGEDNDKDDPVLSTGAIIGIAIGGAAFLVIVGVLIWYLTGKSSTSVAPASMTTTVAPA